MVKSTHPSPKKKTARSALLPVRASIIFFRALSCPLRESRKKIQICSHSNHFHPSLSIFLSLLSRSSVPSTKRLPSEKCGRFFREHFGLGHFRIFSVNFYPFPSSKRQIKTPGCSASLASRQRRTCRPRRIPVQLGTTGDLC